MHSCKFLLPRSFSLFHFPIDSHHECEALHLALATCDVPLLFVLHKISFLSTCFSYCCHTKMVCVAGISFCKIQLFHVSSKIQNHAGTQVIFFCSSFLSVSIVTSWGTYCVLFVIWYSTHPHGCLGNNDIICHYLSFSPQWIRIIFILVPQPLFPGIGSQLECSML